MALGQEADKAFYSAVSRHDPARRKEIELHVVTVRNYLNAVVHCFREHIQGPNRVDILELGAGSCLTSLMLRKLFPDARLTCLDISVSRMQGLIAESAAMVGTHPDGIELIEADICGDLPLESRSFDIVVFDASLHHSRNVWTTLRECARVLRPDGAIAALREQYLGLLTYRYALTRLLRTPEVRAGVAENAYLKEQYAYYLRAAGFEPTFYPVCPSARWRLLSPLNGLVHSKWSIWAPKIKVPRDG